MASSEEYQIKVMAAYHELRAAGTLSGNLANPTPASLREECLAVLEERYQIKDELILREFFGPEASKDAYEVKVRNIDVDRFRPLVKLLKDQSITPRPKNYRLLAWLIGYEAGSIGKPPQAIPSPQLAPAIAAVPVPQPGNPGAAIAATKKSRNLFKWIVAALFFITGLAGAGYRFWEQHIQAAALMLKADGCMYWAGAQYRRIPCDVAKGDTLIIPLDAGLLLHFRQIKDTAGITRHGLGKTWYFKHSPGHLEYFNDSGMYPPDTNRRLKRLTPYMYKKYILKQ